MRTIAPVPVFAYPQGMAYWARMGLMIMVVAGLAATASCSAGDSNQGDEEKEPHYVLGNSCYNDMDWPGAIEAFQESLEVNPHSAAAHFRLAELYDTKYPDPAAAIYHYQEYLKLEPDAKNRDVINARIHSCKVLLASDEIGLPDAPAIQKQMESLVIQNHQLQAQVDQLTGQLRAWSAYYLSLKTAGLVGANGAPVQPAVQSGQENSGATLSASPDDISNAGAPATPSSSGQQLTTQAKESGIQTVKTKSARQTSLSGRRHFHTVAFGETMAAIARKEGLSLTSLEDANPKVNPRKLHVGQVLILPP